MTVADIHTGRRVSVATKLAYGVGAASESIKSFSFALFLLFFYTTVMGLPGTLVGLAVSIGLVWDSAIDPLIGYFSDRAPMRLGRRHPFMIVGALCAGVSFFAVFNPPAGLTNGALFAWLLVSSLCLRSSNSLFMVPYYALGAELADDYHERTSVSGFRAAGAFAGTLLAAAAAFLVFFPRVRTGIDPKFAASSYSSMALAFGTAISVVGAIATFGTWAEQGRVRSSVTDRSRPALGKAPQGALQNRAFRVLVLSSSLFFMGAAINAALAMHLLTYHARIPADQPLGMYFVAFYLGALAGVVIWTRVAKRVEKHLVYAGAALLTALITSGGYWLVGEGRVFGTGDPWPLVVGNAIAGLFGSAMLVVAPSMMADITGQDEIETGRRRDGVFFGIYSFGQQMSAGLAVLVSGVLVDRFAGLVPGQAAQSATTAERLAMLASLLPALVFVTASLIVLRYNLTRRQIEIRRDAALRQIGLGNHAQWSSATRAAQLGGFAGGDAADQGLEIPSRQ